LCYRNVKNSLVFSNTTLFIMFSMERQFDVGLSEQLRKDCRGRATCVLAGRNGRNCIFNHAERGFPSAAGHRAIITGVFGDRGPQEAGYDPGQRPALRPTAAEWRTLGRQIVHHLQRLGYLPRLGCSALKSCNAFQYYLRASGIRAHNFRVRTAFGFSPRSVRRRTICGTMATAV
jgi:hypothetical protein